MPGYAQRGWGRGGGRGFGGGRGWGRGRGFGMGAWMPHGWGEPPFVQPDPVQEHKLLQDEQSYLTNRLEQIQKRLDELGE